MNETLAVRTDVDRSSSSAARAPFLAPADPRQEIERVPEVLSLTKTLTGMDLGFTGCAISDYRTALKALLEAERATSEALAKLATGPSESAQRLVALSLRLHQMQVYLRDALFNERSTAILGVQRSLQRLRGASTLDELLYSVPNEINAFGFRRSLVSTISDSLWIAKVCSVEDDDQLAEEIVRAGSAAPRKLTHTLPEAEMIRRRQPILVPDVEGNQHIHPELKEATQSRAYVAAPVMSGSNAIGLLHADESMDSARVEDFHREVLGMFAEGIGYAVERTVLHDRLSALRDQLQEHTARVNDIVDQFVESDIQMSADTGNPTGTTPQVTHPASARPGSKEIFCSLLTYREQEVFRLMAAGQTNAGIASSLILSEGTVKSHVKHILRKLGVANRAEAVSRFYQSGS